MTQFQDTHVDKSLGATGTWTDIDLSGDIPANATGAIFKVIDTQNTDKAFGLRKKGSSDDRYYDLESGAQQFYIVGLDANRKCQGKIESLNTDFWLIGYTEADATMLTNGVDKSLTSYGAWTDIDLSANLPAGAVAAIFEVVNSDSSSRMFGLRKNGSTDEHYNDTFATSHRCYVVGVDDNRKCEGKAEGSSVDFYLIGYLTMGIAETNGIDRSIGSLDTYVDITETNAPAGATGVFVAFVTVGSAYSFAARKNGATDDTFEEAGAKNAIICVGLDANKKWEGKIDTLVHDFYTLGYFAAGTEEKIKNSSIGITVVTRATKSSSASMAVAARQTKESSIGLRVIDEKSLDWTEVEAFSGETQVRRLGVFKNYLYAGTVNSGKLFRSSNGTDWALVEDFTTIYSIEALTVFGNYFYLGGCGDGIIYRSLNGTDWSVAKDTGDGNVWSLEVFKGYLYAGTSPGGKIWRTANGTDWTMVEDTTEGEILSLGAVGNYIYAGTAWEGKIYRSSDGLSWAEVEDSTEIQIFAFKEYNDYIYAGGGNNGIIFRSPTGSVWGMIQNTPETHIRDFVSFCGNLYAVSGNAARVYRTDAGITWTLESEIAAAMIYSAVEFGDGIYIGTGDNGKVFKGVSAIGCIPTYKASSISMMVIQRETKTSSIGLTVQKTETKTTSIGLRIVEAETKEKQSSIGLTVSLINRTMRSGLLVFGGISEDGRIEIAAGILEDGTRTFKLLIQKPSTIGLRVVGRKTKTSSIGLNIVTLETKTSSIGLTIKILPIKASSIGLSVIDTFIKASTISMCIVDQKTKPSTIGLRVVGRKTKTSSIGLNIVTLENVKVSIVGLRIIVQKTKSSLIGLAITGSETKQSCIGIDISPCFTMEYESGMLISDGISEDGRIEIAAGILEDGNFRVLAKPVTKTSSIGLDIVIRKTKMSYIGVAVSMQVIKSSSIGLAISEPETKASSIGMYIYGSNTKVSSIGLTPIDSVLSKGFFYAKLGATSLYGVTPENFRISKEINKIPTFEFEIANCTENRTAITTGIEDEFKIYWQHHGVDTLIFTGIVNADGIEYVSLDSIEITGYASYVVLSWPFHKHLASGDKEPVDKVLSYDGAYVDYTTAANNATVNDVDMDFSVVNHALYIGDAQPFWGAQIKYSTKGVRTGEGEIAIEYSKGSGVWATLDALDESDAFTQDPGTFDLVISHPPSDWARDTVDGVKKYWIRYRVNSIGYTTNPRLDQIYIVNVDIYRTYYFDTSARQILLNALEGTEYTMDTVDTCPEDEISLIAEYESPLRIVAAIPNALTWTDTDGSKKGYQWWVDDSKKVHIKQRRGTIQPDDITGDMTIFNNHEDYFHLSNRLHGLGSRDGLSQIRSIVQDRASITEHKLREIAVPKEQVGDYIMLRNALEKDIAISKAPMQRIKGSVTTEFWGIRGYEVGDTVTLHQTAWNLDEIQMQIVKAEIGPQRTTLNLGISQEHLEGLKDNMQRRLDLNNVRMHGSTTLLQVGNETMNYQRVSASEVYSAKLDIKIQSEVKKIHKVLLSWTIGPYRASVNEQTGEGSGHDHDGFSGSGGAIGSGWAGAGGAFTPNVLADGEFIPEMLSKAHIHRLQDTIILYYNTVEFWACMDGSISGGNHRHYVAGKYTGGPDGTSYVMSSLIYGCDCSAACGGGSCVYDWYGINVASTSHEHYISAGYTGYTDPGLHVNGATGSLISSIEPYYMNELSDSESPAHIHDGVYEPAHDHVGVYEGDHSDHTIPAEPAHSDHLIVTEPGFSLDVDYGIHEEPAGTTLELLVNDEKVGEYATGQTEIRIDGYLNSGNNTVKLQPIVGANKKGGATIWATGILFFEPRKF